MSLGWPEAKKALLLTRSHGGVSEARETTLLETENLLWDLCDDKERYLKFLNATQTASRFMPSYSKRLLGLSL